MIRFAFILVSAVMVTLGSAWACSGADPAILSARAVQVTDDGATNHYLISGTVKNLGMKDQAANALQFVDIYYGGTRHDSKSIPPLKRGQSFTFTYTYLRSDQAGKGTSHIRFQLRMRQPSAVPSAEDCDMSNDRYALTL